MTRLEVRQQKKNQALNKIIQIYHTKYRFPYDEYDEDSCSEQRERKIRYIIEELENELNSLKQTPSEIRDEKLDKLLK